MRSIATAAREALEGIDETLYMACMDKRTAQDCLNFFSYSNAEQLTCLLAEIRSMTSEERALYGVSDE